jgi:DNA-binding MarR family transcriptional regulator
VDYPVLYSVVMANVIQQATPEFDPGIRRRLGKEVASDAEGRLYDPKFREMLTRRGRLDEQTLGEVEAMAAFFGAGKAVQEVLEDRLQDHGVSLPQFKALTWIRDSGSEGCKLHMIADWLGTTPRNVTGLIDGLESLGLVERVADPLDRRATIARMTPAGETRAIAAKRTHHRNVREILGVLTPAEKADLRHIALKLIRAAGSSAGNGRPASALRSRTNG